MSVRTFLFRVLLVMVVLALCVGIAEAWLRGRLDSDAPAYKDWRDPGLFTWQYKVDNRTVVSDDHDKLAFRWGLARPSTDHPHPLLGWCEELDSITLLPMDFVPTRKTGHLVMLGAGWDEHTISGTTERLTPELQSPGGAQCSCW